MRQGLESRLSRNAGAAFSFPARLSAADRAGAWPSSSGGAVELGHDELAVAERSAAVAAGGHLVHTFPTGQGNIFAGEGPS